MTERTLNRLREWAPIAAIVLATLGVQVFWPSQRLSAVERKLELQDSLRSQDHQLISALVRLKCVENQLKPEGRIQLQIANVPCATILPSYGNGVPGR